MKGLVFALGFVGLASSANAVFSYNALSDFSLSSNPNGTWSYGWSTTTSPALTFNAYSLIATYGGGGIGFHGWVAAVAGTVGDTSKSMVGKNGNVDTTNGTTGTDNLLVQHTGTLAGGAPISIVRWTAPSAGTVLSVSGAWTNMKTGTDPTAHHDLLINGAGTNKFSAVGAGGTAGTTNAFSVASFAVTAGQTIDFIEGPGSNGNSDNASDHVSLDASISFQPVPEPATLAALGLGAIALIRRRKR